MTLTPSEEHLYRLIPKDLRLSALADVENIRREAAAAERKKWAKFVRDTNYPWDHTYGDLVPDAEMLKAIAVEWCDEEGGWTDPVESYLDILVETEAEKHWRGEA